MFSQKETLLVILLTVFAVNTWKSDASSCKTLFIQKPLRATHVVTGVEHFSVGDVLKFHCDNSNPTKPRYKLKGPPKIECQKGGLWSSKIPRCLVAGCPISPPLVPHAKLMTTIISGATNLFGRTVNYRCNLGFEALMGNHVKICEKNGHWEGNVTCVGVVCPRPSISHGNVTYSSLGYGSKANYSCNKGYAVSGQSIQICNSYGQWTGTAKCLRLCPQLKDPANGRITPASISQTSGSSVKIVCNSNYRIKGSERLTCGSDGSWIGRPPKCVINTCGSPGPFDNGTITANKEGYVIGTEVYFQCHTGYQLINGESKRICMVDGHWTGARNPTCKEVFCEEPGIIPNGYHHTDTQYEGRYPYGSSVTYACQSQYYLLGNASIKCISNDHESNAHWSGLAPRCLTLTGYDEACVRLKGTFKVIRGHPHCLFPTSSNSASNYAKESDQELDTLTIVTASAGSTLGALVILLSVMLFVRRFHRSRRFRNHSIRSRFYSDDDHVTLIATYRGDVQFTLPSYDEAMNQIQRDPPPFESVVQSNGSGPTNNNSTILAITDGSSSLVNSTTNNSSEHARNEGSANQQINIVSNPMNVDSSVAPELQSQARSEENPNEPQENFVLNSFPSEESLAESDALSSHDGLNLSISEDEQSVNESRPLITSNT